MTEAINTYIASTLGNVGLLVLVGGAGLVAILLVWGLVFRR